jgi:hypothetical protein
MHESIKIITDGKIFLEDRETLLKCTFFKDLFKFNSLMKHKGDIKLEIDGYKFAKILNYLNRETAHIPLNCKHIVDYLGVDYLFDECATEDLIPNEPYQIDRFQGSACHYENIGGHDIKNEIIYLNRYDKFTKSIPFNDRPDFDRSLTLSLPHHGHFVSKVYLVIELGPLKERCRWVKNLGHVLIDQVSMSYFGNTINSYSGEYLDIYHELYVPKNRRYDETIFNYNDVQTRSKLSKRYLRLIIPLLIHSTRSISLVHTQSRLNINKHGVLPLISIPHDSYQIDISFKAKDRLVLPYGENCGGEMKGAYLLVDYISIDSPETINRPFKYFDNYVNSTIVSINEGDTRVTKTSIILHSSGVMKDIVIVMNREVDLFNKHYFGYRKDILICVEFFIDQTLALKLTPEMMNTFIPINSNGFTSKKGIYQYSWALSPVSKSSTGGIIINEYMNVELIITSVNIKGKIHVYQNMQKVVNIDNKLDLF